MTSPMTRPLPLALALLAGGASTRMGRDKAGLPLAGTTLLAHLAGLGAEVGLPVLICGRSRPAGWTSPPAIFLTDAAPGEGPLRGLEAAFLHAESVLLLACDLPLLTAADLAWLIGAPTARHGTAVLRDGQVEPLFSRYHATCRPLLAAELTAGRRSPARLLATGTFARVTAPPEVAAHLTDADTPGDWQTLTTT